MKKRFLCLFLAILMVCTLLPVTAAAEGGDDEIGYDLTWTLKGGVLTISGTGEMFDFYDEAPWHEQRNEITSVVIEKGVTSIGACAFEWCENLKSVTIPDSVTKIGNAAFIFCESLASVTIPDSVTSIDAYAFSGCDSLTSVTIPENVSYIGDGPFSTNKLTKITVSKNNEYYCAENGVLFNIDKTTIVQYPAAKSDASYKIPNGVTTIGGGAFQCCHMLKNVTIPNSVTDIRFNAFNDCRITSLTIPNSVTNIEDSAFLSCIELKSVSMSKSVKNIGLGAFDSCFELEDVYYCDSEKEWNGIAIAEENDYLTDANIHFNTHSYKDGKCTVCGAKDPNYKPAAKNPFVDVAKGSYCYDAVLWAVDKGITKGIDKTHFAPNNDCTRGQIVTFLWRANGSPAPKTTKCPFVDVEKGSYCYDAVLWAVEKGITTGFDATHFKPSESCTRGQVVTFLWRADGKPAPASTKCPFKDVTKGAFYYDAMLWAVGEGITNGVDTTHFAPNQTCNRGQIVTFLYRDLA